MTKQEKNQRGIYLNENDGEFHLAKIKNYRPNQNNQIHISKEKLKELENSATDLDNKFAFINFGAKVNKKDRDGAYDEVEKFEDEYGNLQMRPFYLNTQQSKEISQLFKERRI